MNKQELNKKLAEWAGFKHTQGGGWITPDSNKARLLCDFTNSLDACFKWLVPKLWEVGENYIILQQRYSNPAFKIANVEFVNINRRPNSYEGEGDTHTLALCLAIEKLIDGGI